MKLGKFAFLNVWPIYYALETGRVDHDFEIVAGSPAQLNEKMRRGELDLSPVSSVAYARHPDRMQLLPGIAIACDGPVQSVLLLSRRPVEDLDGQEILLTRQSDTSVVLLKVLMQELLGFRRVRYRRGGLREGLENGAPPTAFLAIGDEALVYRNHPDYPYVWDLAEVWKRWTGLPFVFALWVVRRGRRPVHTQAVGRAVEALWAAKRWGLEHLDVICAQAARTGILDHAGLERYYRTFSFGLNGQTLAGLELFFRHMVRIGDIGQLPPLDFVQAGPGTEESRVEIAREGGREWVGNA
ncbi:menaquinone biosynthetic enzyme MqnA/MqnD family protein [Desulfacinum hydrothermale]|uniref:menaquinone biosynthetic enzyme MqnA/MqnD family protein n=1 Tax=Desulfacinum hydrothermale TaxID=109258 RepID=UPI001482E773|nr:menaquinone biosynthesis protein [Desulfacinum hydrothermale]